jgi:hypothetical protein
MDFLLFLPSITFLNLFFETNSSHHNEAPILHYLVFLDLFQEAIGLGKMGPANALIFLLFLPSITVFFETNSSHHNGAPIFKKSLQLPTYNKSLSRIVNPSKKTNNDTCHYCCRTSSSYYDGCLGFPTGTQDENLLIS